MCRPISDLRICGAFPFDRGGRAVGFLLERPDAGHLCDLGAAPLGAVISHSQRSACTEQPRSHFTPTLFSAPQIVTRVRFPGRVPSRPSIQPFQVPSPINADLQRNFLFHRTGDIAPAVNCSQSRRQVPASQQLGLQHRDDGGPTTSQGVCIRLTGNPARDIANGNTQQQAGHRASRADRQQPAIARAISHPPSAIAGVNVIAGLLAVTPKASRSVALTASAGAACGWHGRQGAHPVTLARAGRRRAGEPPSNWASGR